MTKSCEDCIFYDCCPEDGCPSCDMYINGICHCIQQNFMANNCDMFQEDLTVTGLRKEIENLKLQLQHAQENEEVLTKNAEEIAKQAVRDFAEKLKTSIRTDEDMYQQAEELLEWVAQQTQKE